MKLRILYFSLLGGLAVSCASNHQRHSKDQPDGPEGAADQQVVVVEGDERLGPPPLRNDPIPVQPRPDANWLPGHWLRDRALGAWVWVPGRWK